MEGNELVRSILVAHKTAKAFEPYKGVVIEPQTGYRGLVAVTAYRMWRGWSHRDRPKVGLFDVKVLAQEEGIEHERSVILPTVSLLAPEMAEAVFVGESPDAAGGDARERLVMATLQAAMAEQEVNWGNEVFQCKTHFLPPERRTYDKRNVTSRPRDLLMGYIRKCYALRRGRKWSPRVESEITAFLAQCRGQNASRSAALLPHMKGRYVDPVWEPFHEDPTGRASPWLWGGILQEYRAYAATAPPNPRYQRPTGGS